MRSPDKRAADAIHPAAEAALAYRAPRIDDRLLTIVVQRTPDSRGTQLAGSRKNLARRRWF